MSKKKVAESIIIRVGGGIREVPREPVEVLEGLESANLELGLEASEEPRSFGVELGSKRTGDHN